MGKGEGGKVESGLTRIARLGRTMFGTVAGYAGGMKQVRIPNLGNIWRFPFNAPNNVVPPRSKPTNVGVIPVITQNRARSRPPHHGC